MYEALHFASDLKRAMELHHFKDGGADIRVVVTDTAGTNATIQWDKEQGKWVCDEGVDVDLMLLRCGDDTQQAEAFKRLQEKGKLG